MSKCSVSTCEKEGTQLLVLPGVVKDGEAFVYSENTLYLEDDGELCFGFPGPPIPLCAQHYDETIAYYRHCSEMDRDDADEYREIVKLNT